VDPTAREISDLVIRWIHLIAGIMWIGNSLLFNWLDRNLVKLEAAKEGHIGEIWLLHSGAFYQVEKKLLPPNQMPAVVHWFKWQSYTTWMSGIALLVLVYYMGGAGMLVDPAVRDIPHGAAVAIGAGFLAGGFLGYDLIWRSPLRRCEALGNAATVALIGGAIVALHHVFGGRAAYIHTGALLGTIMSGNVFFHIIPSQRELVRATLEGRPQDPAISLHAKQRSIHNNYLTFPVLFIMLSNHFPSTYGSARNWAVLAILMTGGALVRHFLNIRFHFRPWLAGVVATFAIVIGAIVPLARPDVDLAGLAEAYAGEPVSFLAVQAVVKTRCVQCHSAQPTDAVWKIAPNDVRFDTPAEMKRHADRMLVRAVVNKTMPLGNQTGMTQDERDLLARWVLGGAKTEVEPRRP
jgi:uncharacterized membrane protein